MRDLIFEKKAGSLELAADSNLVKPQEKLLDVMRPLSKIWTKVEKASNSRFEQVDVSLPEILTNLDQTSDVNIRADFVRKFSTCLWQQTARNIFKFMFWSDLNI